MTNLRIAVALSFLFLAACASTPDTNSDLDALNARLKSNENSDTVQQYAALELDDAAVKVRQANNAWDTTGNSVDYEHRLYLAQRAVDLAETKANVKNTEAKAKALSSERERLRLQANVDRARSAQQMAERERQLASEQAAMSAAEAQRAAEAKAAADLAREQAEAERLAADAARLASDEARAQAEVARQQAAMEREAALAERAAAEELRAEAEARAAAAEARTNQLLTELSELKAKETERGIVLTLQDVLFDFDKADLKAGGARQIEKIAAFLRNNPERQVRVEGFTDNVGAEEYNQGLSQRRADAVGSALIDNEIDAGRIIADGFGENYPVASNDTEAGRQRNRRVEIIISSDDQPVEVRGDAGS